MTITAAPGPTAEEVAAIIAAHEALWPVAIGVVGTAPVTPPWRFSGRWWSSPLPVRHTRPR